MAIALFLLIAEGLILWQGQRRLFWLTVEATRSHWLAYLLAAPGTILHESSHFIACLVLRVPAGGAVGERVRFFAPKRNEEDGSVVLGYVPHAKTDPLRGALSAIAPILLGPPLLVGISMLLLGDQIIKDPSTAISDAAPWRVLLWVYFSLSCGQAAFPSPGDHIGIIGGVMLVLLAVALASLFSHSKTGLEEPLMTAVIILAPAAIGALLAGIIFYPLAQRRRRK